MADNQFIVYNKYKMQREFVKEALTPLRESSWISLQYKIIETVT